MSTSEHINEIAAALSKAQGEMKNAPLNKTNPHFKSKYADLAAVRDATIPHLSKHGIAVVQYTETVAAGMLLHTKLLHTSGQWLDGTYTLDVDLSKPQAIGSAMKYGMRYCLAAMCCIASEDDDDGNAAQEQARAHTSGNGNAIPAMPDASPYVYERLVKTMRVTKSSEALGDWKASNTSDINGLSKDWYDRLIGIYHEHKASLPKPAKLSEQAISADKPPLPDDEVRME